MSGTYGFTEGPWTINKYGGIGSGPLGLSQFIIAADGWAHDYSPDEHRRKRADMSAIAALPKLVEALEAHEEWARKEDEGPQYPDGMTRNSPGGEAVWHAWWQEQLYLCDRANKLTKAILSKLREGSGT